MGAQGRAQGAALPARARLLPRRAQLLRLDPARALLRVPRRRVLVRPHHRGRAVAAQPDEPRAGHLVVHAHRQLLVLGVVYDKLISAGYSASCVRWLVLVATIGPYCI